MLYRTNKDRGEFTLDDFMAQMSQVRNLGTTSRVFNLIPGMSRMARNLKMGSQDVERQMTRMRGIFDSMNTSERIAPERVSASRRRRMARGAGVPITEVSQFIRQFEVSQSMMRTMSSMTIVDKFTLVLGLVTPSRFTRDPSYLHRPSRARQPLLEQPLVWILCLIAAIACAVAFRG